MKHTYVRKHKRQGRRIHGYYRKAKAQQINKSSKESDLINREVDKLLKKFDKQIKPKQTPSRVEKKTPDQIADIVMAKVIEEREQEPIYVGYKGNLKQAEKEAEDKQKIHFKKIAELEDRRMKKSIEKLSGRPEPIFVGIRNKEDIEREQNMIKNKSLLASLKLDPDFSKLDKDRKIEVLNNQIKVFEKIPKNERLMTEPVPAETYYTHKGKKVTTQKGEKIIDPLEELYAKKRRLSSRRKSKMASWTPRDFKRWPK